MAKSSKARRSKAIAKKRLSKAAITAGALTNGDPDLDIASFSQTDKRYLIAFSVLAAVITAGYFWLGGRNIFIFPAILCISVGARKYWNGPVRRFATKQSRVKA